MKRIIFDVLRRFGHQPFARVMRGKTLGVRVVAFDFSGAVMLVKHTYTEGWILPGGGVEKGEQLISAAIREIREEAGLIAEGPLSLHGIFSNETVFAGDFVCCYVLRQFSREDWKPNFEIADARFFKLDQLPTDVTQGSRSRLNEIVHGQALSEHW